MSKDKTPKETLSERIQQSLNDSKKGPLPETHPWWINSPENGNNFWEFLFKNSNKYGVLRELSTQEMAKLMGWNSTRMLAEIKEATEALKEVMKDELDLQELLEYIELSKKFKA